MDLKQRMVLGIAFLLSAHFEACARRRKKLEDGIMFGSLGSLGSLGSIGTYKYSNHMNSEHLLAQ